MNQLDHFGLLKNRYFGMRHGQSMANCEGLIVSKPENGVLAYGLSSLGYQQVRQSIGRKTRLDASLRIISSDFKRAHESAQIAHEALKCTYPLALDKRLRERNFGDFELTAECHYQEVWKNDKIDSSHTLNKVESVDSVRARTAELILSLEKQFTETVFLLVAHGDALQILQTVFDTIPASKHRQINPIDVAEIREFNKNRTPPLFL
jgi:probable phosphoglycerate mutase